MPSFKEEYGDGKPIDLVGTISHDFIDSGLEGDQTPSGITIEKNGNFHIDLNIGVQMIIETSHGKWEDARTMYMTLSLKGKMFVADAKFDNRTFVVLPKGIYLSTLKIMKDDQEQFLEQMLV